MKIHLKPLSEQVIVITGASSGIGRATALQAGRRHASIVLVSRDSAGLAEVASQIGTLGGRAVCVEADVGVQENHDKIVEAAVSNFGGIDTWVNNAGISIFGELDQIPMADQRQLFETNFWGVVYGSLAAVAHFKQRGGGALINIGSEVSDVGLPLQGIYSASKHAVKGYTDALRMELLVKNCPIAVTLIKPASIHTSFTENARNYMDVEPRLPSPLYSADAVAGAILFAAENPRRDIYVGSASKLISALSRGAPTMTDKLSKTLWRQQRSSTPATPKEGALYHSRNAGSSPPQEQRWVHQRSLYTTADTVARPAMLGAALALALAALAATGTKAWIHGDAKRKR